MSICQPFYQILEHFVNEKCKDLSKWAKARLVWYIFGIVVSQSVVFSRLAYRQVSVLPCSPMLASGERRLRRLANDDELDWQRAYRPALKAVICKAAEAKRLVVLVDETAQAEHSRLLMAALWYRSGAIPLAWHLREAKAGQFWEAMRQVLAQTAQVLPVGVEIVVVGDRGFGSPAFCDLVASMGWHWLVRLQGQTLFKVAQGHSQAVKSWLSRAGTRRKALGQLFKKQGWRSGSLVGVWNAPHKEALLLGSSLPPDYTLVRIYKYRYAIEALFRDFKSYGFKWEQSQVRDLEHCQKVVVGLSWGVLVAVVLGEEVAESELKVKPTGRRYSRPHPAKFGLVYKGLERVQSYLVSKEQSPPQWELKHFEAGRWSKQIQQHHALAYIAVSIPQPEVLLAA